MKGNIQMFNNLEKPHWGKKKKKTAIIFLTVLFFLPFFQEYSILDLN